MDQEKVYSDTSLFVGDLAQLSTEVELAECFSQYGELAEVRIMRNNTTRKPLCYGFVTFAIPENAKTALESLNGQPFQGRNLRLGWAAHNFQVRKTEESVVNSLYVRFSSPQIKDMVTEETLHGVFDQYNNVIDVSIKKVVCDEAEGTQSGYGFVHFSTNQAGITSAFQALSAVHHTTIDTVEYNVEASKNLLKQFKESAPRAKPATAKQKPAEYPAAQVGANAPPRGAAVGAQVSMHAAAASQRGGQSAKPRGTYAEAGAVGPGGFMPRAASAAMLTTGQLRGNQSHAAPQYPNPPHQQWMPHAPHAAQYEGGQYGYAPMPVPGSGPGPYGHPPPHQSGPGPLPARSPVHLAGQNGMQQHARGPFVQAPPLQAPYWLQQPQTYGAYAPYDQAANPPYQPHYMQNQPAPGAMPTGNFYAEAGSARESFYISPASSGSGDAPAFSVLLQPMRSARNVAAPHAEAGYAAGAGQSAPGWSPRADAPAYSPPPGQLEHPSAASDAASSQAKTTLMRVPTQYTANRPTGARDLDMNHMTHIGVSKSVSTDRGSVRTSTTLGRTDSEGDFFSSSSSSLGMHSMPYAVPGALRDAKPSFTMPPTPSTIASHTLPSFSETSAANSFTGTGTGATTAKRGQSRSKVSMSVTMLANADRSFSMASQLSDDEELVEDEFTYSPSPSLNGANNFNANDIVPCFSHQSSSTSTFNSSFYNAFPVDTTFLETPNSSTHSMRSHLACRSSEAADTPGSNASSIATVRERRESDTQGVAVVEETEETEEEAEDVEPSPDTVVATAAVELAKSDTGPEESAEANKAAAKSRQLPVTHFFKPSNKQAEE